MIFSFLFSFLILEYVAFELFLVCVYDSMKMAKEC